MSTLTNEEQKKIADFLKDAKLSKGLGDPASTCSLGAINLALSDNLTDKIPDCMSDVIGRWIIAVQDAMPYKIRNTRKWKNLLPLAAGTGRIAEDEEKRLKALIDHIYSLYKEYQDFANTAGFGTEWTTIVEGGRCSDVLIVMTLMKEKHLTENYLYQSLRNFSDWISVTKSTNARSISAVYTMLHLSKHGLDWSVIDPCGLLKKLIEA